MKLPEKGRGFRRTLASLVLLCVSLAYLHAKVDFSEFIRALSTVKFQALAAIMAYALVMRIPQTLRIYYLADKRTTLWISFQAIFIRLGVNNFLPARLGDAAVVYFLAKHGGIGLGKSLEVYFWSHLLNLLLILATGLLATSFSGIPFVSKTLMLLTLLLLAGVVALVIYGKNMVRLLGKLPDNRLVMVAISKLSEKKPPYFYTTLVTLSVLTYVMSWGLVFLVLHFATGLSLTVPQIILVFAATVFCEAIPGTPGSIGVFESAVVFVLGYCGIPEGQALAGALVLHTFIFVPSSLLGGVFLVTNGLKLSNIKSSKGELGKALRLVPAGRNVETPAGCSGKDGGPEGA